MVNRGNTFFNGTRRETPHVKVYVELHESPNAATLVHCCPFLLSVVRFCENDMEDAWEA